VACTGHGQTDGDTRRALVVNYLVSNMGLNTRLTGRALAAAVHATDCRAWITNWGSHGPAEALEVHLLVDSNGLGVDEAKLTGLVKRPRILQRSAARFDTPPPAGRMTVRTKC
jgi:hypothetical protein